MNFFHFSKIGWFFLDPANILIAMLVLGFVMMFTHFRYIGQGVIGLSLFSILIITFLPIDNLLIRPLENYYPSLLRQDLPKHVDGIIVLGGAVSPTASIHRNQIQINDSAERLTSFLELAKHYPNAKLIYSGGSGSLFAQGKKEADIVKDWMAVNATELLPRTLFENQSRNTYENATLSKALAKPQNGDTWILITSASHMPRSKAIFDKQNWNTIPYPVDYQTHGDSIWDSHGVDFIGNLYLIRKAVKEYVSTFAYWLSGKL